jgi:pimeloyl-ACP methyl ester carboxylesterase
MKRARERLACVVFLVLLAGCTQAPNPHSTPPVTRAVPLPPSAAPQIPGGPSGRIPADSTRLARTFDVNGRAMYLECNGASSPTIVMDAGLATDHTTWDGIVGPLARVARVCTYDRAGLGASDRAPRPRTSQDVVDDLHRLLDAAGIDPPFLLVGHSFGGLNMQLFAAEDHTDVAGLVLVEPAPAPGFVELGCKLLKSVNCLALTTALAANPEGIDWARTDAEIADAPPLGRIPLVVIAATSHPCPLSPASECAKLETVAMDLWKATVRSVPDGQLVIASGSGHWVQDDRPDVVIGAIKGVLAKARGGVSR